MTEKKHLSILDVNIPDWMPNIKPVERDFIEDLGLETEKLFKDIYIFFRNISIGIKNIIYYFPVIWNDRHWDYEFLLDIVEVKIKNMREGINKDDLVVETPKIVSQMDKTLAKIQGYRDAFERFEIQSYNDLIKIRDSKDDIEKSILIKRWYTNQVNFENKCWDEIWDSIKENGRGWWN